MTGQVSRPGRRRKRTDPRRQDTPAGPQFCGRCDHDHALWAAAGVVIVCPGPDGQR